MKNLRIVSKIYERAIIQSVPDYHQPHRELPHREFSAKLHRRAKNHVTQGFTGLVNPNSQVLITRNTPGDHQPHCVRRHLGF